MLDVDLLPVGSAYTDNLDGTTSTTLYTVDAGNNQLAVNSGGPAFNTLTAVGGFTVDGSDFFVGQIVGFDISDLGTAYLSSGNSLYTVDLATAALTLVGAFDTTSTVTGISVQPAVVPEPGSLALVAAAVAGPLAARVRRRKAAVAG